MSVPLMNTRYREVFVIQSVSIDLPISVPFPADNASIKVYWTDKGVSNAEPIKLTENYDYYLKRSTSEDKPFGSVKLVTKSARYNIKRNDLITIERNVEPVYNDSQSVTKFLNEIFSRIYEAIQDSQILNYTIHSRVDEIINNISRLQLPKSDEWANKLIGFNDKKNITLYPISGNTPAPTEDVDVIDHSDYIKGWRVLYGQTLKTVEKEKRKNCILYMDQNGSWTYIPYTLEANKITLHLGDAHG